MIRNALVGLMTRDEGTMSELYVANTSVELPKGRLAHLFHCVDYLKQNILCEADTTLEWRSESNPEHVDGYGIPHQCRDWVSCVHHPHGTSCLLSNDRTKCAGGWWRIIL